MFGIRRALMVALVLGSVCTAVPAQYPPPTPPTEKAITPLPTGTAATVNGQAVTEAAVQRALLGVPPDKRDLVRADKVQALIDITLMNQYLQQANPPINTKDVDDQMNKIREEIKKNGGEVDKVLRSLYTTEEEVKNEITALLRWESFLKLRATDGQLQALLEKEPELVDGSTVRARHILITPASNDATVCAKAAADLKQIKQDVEKKVADGLAKLPQNTDALTRGRERCKLLDAAFSEAAKEKSSCPSKEVGGDVNYFPRCGSMVEPFAKAAFALKPYEMSGVVKTQFGYHLILVTDRKPGTPVKFETMKEELKEFYGFRLQQEILVQLRAQSKIAVNPPPAKASAQTPSH